MIVSLQLYLFTERHVLRLFQGAISINLDVHTTMRGSQYRCHSPFEGLCRCYLLALSLGGNYYFLV